MFFGTTLSFDCIISHLFIYVIYVHVQFSIINVQDPHAKIEDLAEFCQFGPF